MVSSMNEKDSENNDASTKLLRELKHVMRKLAYLCSTAVAADARFCT